MKFNYDKNKDAFYIRFEESPYAESDEIEDGVIFDYNRQGKIIGIEILNASKRLGASFRSSFQEQNVAVGVK